MEEKQFKDSMNRWLTSGLFKETAQTPDFIIYTLEEARQDYLACVDVTGYIFATTFLGGWKHWLALKESPALEGYIFQWEEELEIKLRCEALQKIFDHAKGKDGYQAAKYVVEAGWKKKSVGRPSKDELKKESRIRSSIYDEFKMEVVR